MGPKALLSSSKPKLIKGQKHKKNKLFFMKRSTFKLGFAQQSQRRRPLGDPINNPLISSKNVRKFLREALAVRHLASINFTVKQIPKA